jgi:hypothetical protein
MESGPAITSQSAPFCNPGSPHTNLGAEVFDGASLAGKQGEPAAGK